MKELTVEQVAQVTGARMSVVNGFCTILACAQTGAAIGLIGTPVGALVGGVVGAAGGAYLALKN